MLRRSVDGLAESGGGGEPSLRSYTPDVSLYTCTRVRGLPLLGQS